MFKIVAFALLGLFVVSAQAGLREDTCSRYASRWTPIIRTGEPKTATYPLGTSVNNKMDAVTTTQGGSTKLVSTNPDFTSLYTLSNGENVMITQFEAPQPSSVYMVGITQDTASGTLTATTTTPVDFSAYGGVWNLCAGQKTPWGTHFGGEEYEPDAKMFGEATTVYGNSSTSLQSLDPDGFSTIIEYLRYFGLYADNSTTMQQVRDVFNPYRYGFAIEVAPSTTTTYKATKWYTAGRNAKELAYVMPNNKTVLITDDGERTAFFKVDLDKAGDMSSGTISIAKFTQKSDQNGGSFDITWIKMGSATQAELQNIINTSTFASIFEYVSPTNGVCPSGFTSINSGGVGQQCLKLKPGQEKAAAFLESRRYGAMLGGTSEFSKWEGLTFSKKRNTIYTAMTEIRRGMEDNKNQGTDSTKYDIGGPNHIRLPYNSCGCVYALSVDASYSPTSMTGIICGTPVTGDSKNTCDLNGIANPDNMAIMDAQDTLLIGEDTTSGHRNDVLWAYNLNNQQLTRILSSPYGAEVTGVEYYPKIGNGQWDYLVGIIQHPYGESDQNLASTAANPFFAGIDGYYGAWAIPSAAIANSDIEFQGIPVATSASGQSKVETSLTLRVCPKPALAPGVGRKLLKSN